MHINDLANLLEDHLEDAKYINHLTRMNRESNIPKAYQYADEKMHRICAWCPDKAEAERLANNVEFKKWVESLRTGVSEYVKRKISHTICSDCTSSMHETITTPSND